MHPASGTRPACRECAVPFSSRECVVAPRKPRCSPRSQDRAPRPARPERCDGSAPTPRSSASCAVRDERTAATRTTSRRLVPTVVAGARRPSAPAGSSTGSAGLGLARRSRRICPPPSSRSTLRVRRFRTLMRRQRGGRRGAPRTWPPSGSCLAATESPSRTRSPCARPDRPCAAPRPCASAAAPRPCAAAPAPAPPAAAPCHPAPPS